MRKLTRMAKLVRMAALRAGIGFAAIASIGLAMIAFSKRPPTPDHPSDPTSAPASGKATAPSPLAPDEASALVLSSLVNVRPDRPLPQGRARIELRALRGECELAQLALSAGARDLLGVSASVEGALGDGVEAKLYRAELVRLERPSGPEGEAGRWHDPLIPMLDVYEGEARAAFPLDVPTREHRSILLELCVDAAATPGSRTASLLIRGGAPLADEPSAHEHEWKIPIGLRIEEAAIPPTSSLPTSFGFSAIRAALGHLGRAGSSAEVVRFDRLYREALLRHRLSVHGGTMEPPPFQRKGRQLVIDFRGYDQELGPPLEGKLLPSGAKATTAELRTHPALESDEERIRYWRSIASHHQQKGWGAILFDYAKDEPKRSELPEIAKRARLVKRASASIRVLLTASLDPSLVSHVDLWTPNLNCLWIKERPDEFCEWRAPPAAYEPLVAKGASLWWYQSCSSHGCGDAPTESPDYFRGWPSYVIDAPGTRARIMGWLAWSHGIEGELYWDTVYGYAPEAEAADPWEGASLRGFGGNGDGTLLYPGAPARIGGTTHVPVESLRLKRIRDGLEDLELLSLVAARPGGERLARAAAAQLAPTPYQVLDDPSAMERSRIRLLDFLAGQARVE